MHSDHAEPLSTITYAGPGGVVVCCAILELLGGVALVGGFATATGLSTQITLFTFIGMTGLFVAVAALWRAE